MTSLGRLDAPPERLELGKDYLFDELVELCSLGDDFARARYPFFIQRYAEREIEAHLFYQRGVVTGSHSEEFVAIVKAATGHAQFGQAGEHDSAAIRRGDFLRGKEYGRSAQVIGGGEQSSMLVGVVEPLNVEKGLIPSLVRLEAFDDYLRIWGKAPYLHDPGWIKAVVSWAFVLIDGELRQRPSLSVACQRPDDVIKNAPEIVDEVAREYRRALSDGLRRVDQPNVIAGLRILVTSETLTVEFSDTPDNLDLQAAQVFVGPLAFEFDTSRYSHGVNSDHEGSADPENRQGTRNPRAEARGSHARLEEAREGVTAAPTEEVASRTAPARQSDGCTAKRIRSGSPEDA